MAFVVWICIGTAFWHFAVLVPDRFYGGIIGALLAANAGAIALGLIIATAAEWPPIVGETGLTDAAIGGLGALIALIASYLIGYRLDPATGTRLSR
jgi:hypothetical protein